MSRGTGLCSNSEVESGGEVMDCRSIVDMVQVRSGFSQENKVKKT